MSMIELTPAKLADIKKKAEAAEREEPSPWAPSTDFSDRLENCVHSGYTLVCNTIDPETRDYIAAADPATVLSMVEEIAVLQRTVRNLVMKYQYDAHDDDIEYEIDQARHQIKSEAGQ